MPSSSRLSSLLFAALLITAPFAFAENRGAQDEATPEPLTATQVLNLLSGNTMVGETQLERFKDRADKTFYVHLAQDRSLTILGFTGKTDSGRWKVTDEGHYCSQYDSTRMGMYRCYAVHPAGNVGGTPRFSLTDQSKGTVSTLFTVAPGNAKGL